MCRDGKGMFAGITLQSQQQWLLCGNIYGSSSFIWIHLPHSSSNLPAGMPDRTKHLWWVVLPSELSLLSNFDSSLLQSLICCFSALIWSFAQRLKYLFYYYFVTIFKECLYLTLGTFYGLMTKWYSLISREKFLC